LPEFPTALGTYTVNIIVSDGVLTSHRSLVRTITPPAILTADGATPASGGAARQTFTLQYSSSLGATNVSTAWVWFSATLATSSSNGCMLYYNRGTSTLYLLNDGQTWMVGALGSSAILQNSQCVVSLSESSVSLSGDSLTLNLAMTFTAAYSGTKQIYMYAQNDSSENSGWQQRGEWTVPGVASAVIIADTVITADSVTPSSGFGETQTFALRFTGNVGASDLSAVWVWFNETFAAASANSCMAYYDVQLGRLHLLNDAQPWIPGALGANAVLQNSQCVVNLDESTVMLSGDTLTLSLAMMFKPAYAGAKQIYTYAQNASNVNSGWQRRGDWTVPGLVEGRPMTPSITADAVAPSGGSGAVQTFSLTYSDTSGATDLSAVWVWFTAEFSAISSNSCMLFYDRGTNQLYLLDDEVTWMGGILGNFGTLQNSQCSVRLRTSSVALNGETLTLDLAMMFTAPYAGDKNIYMYAQNANTVNSGWQDRGEWTVP
jgi:hypothetical protein